MKSTETNGHNLPMRVSILERDLTALDARCRECSARTQTRLQVIAHDITTFGARVAESVTHINKRIDQLIHAMSDDGKRRRKVH